MIFVLVLGFFPLGGPIYGEPYMVAEVSSTRRAYRRPKTSSRKNLVSRAEARPSMKKRKKAISNAHPRGTLLVNSSFSEELSPAMMRSILIPRNAVGNWYGSPNTKRFYLVQKQTTIH